MEQRNKNLQMRERYRQLKEQQSQVSTGDLNKVFEQLEEELED